MPSAIAQLKKLRGRSLREIRERGRQELSKIGERLLGHDSAEMSDEALLEQISPTSRNGSGEGTAALVAGRISSFVAGRKNDAPHTFFPSLARRDEVVAIARARFPEECRLIIERADRAARGRFDLLGFDDLSFGETVDWHLEPVAGRRTGLDHWSRIDYLNPAVAGDKKITWELNRHAHFVTLGQAYWLTGDESYARSFVSQASSWMDSNPPNRGINWASSLELAFRSVAWLWAFHLFACSAHLSSRFVTRFIKCLVAHGRHVESYLSYYFSPNTHLTGEALGLYYLGTALPELERAARWRETGLRILIEQLPRHVNPDGVYFEQSSYYHRYTADFYLHLLALARATDSRLPSEVEERLALALDHLMWLARPDGTTPLIGDDDGGRLVALGPREANDFRDTMATGAAMICSGDWKFVAGRAPIETLWLLGPEGLARFDSIEASVPKQTARAFADGGYFVMRDGWSRESGYLLMDAGPHGAHNCGHAHSDALSIEFAGGGVTWLIDPGTFTYTGDAKLRDYFRSTEAHNTVTVDGEPQSSTAGPFSWSHIARASANEFIAADDFDYIEATHDGYGRRPDPVTHSRSALFVKSGGGFDALPSYVIVRDRMSARASHSYAARFHFSPECAAKADGPTVEATRGGSRLKVAAFGPAMPRARIEQSHVSRAYGRREPAPVAVFEFDGEGPQEMITFIASSPGPGKSISIEPQAVTTKAGAAFVISSSGLSDVIATGDGNGDVECKGMNARGVLAWARFAKDEFIRACLIRGKRIEVKGELSLHSPTSVRCCAIERSGGQVEITIHGATRFDLSFYIPRGEITVNKARFLIPPGSLGAAFVREGSGWKLIAKD